MADLNTEIRIGADASGVEAGVGKAKRSLRDLADAARTTGDGVAASGAKAGRSLSAIGDGGEAAARKVQRDTSAMRGSLQRYLASLEAGSKDSRRYWETMADFKGIDRNALAPLLNQLDAYNAKTKEAAESTASWTGGLSRIGAGVAGVAAITATVGVAAKAMFDASVSAERLRTMLDFSTGGNSAKEIEYLRGITYRLGLEFTSTAKAYSQFSAAAKGTALEGDKARAVFESVAKASSVMGLSAADTSGVLLALQQMISKGTVQAEELRGQLGERLPGAFQIAAKAMGVTTGELGKMLEQGQVIADDFLPKFAAALDKNLGGAAEKAANRLDASVNRLSTAWDRLKQNSGDSGVSSFMAGQYEILADGFNGVSEAMERARGSGSGFIGQMAAGAVAAAKFANPLQAVSYSAIETGNALKQAEAEFAALQKRGDVMGGNIYYKAEMANLAALIKELKAAQAEKQKLATGAAPNMNEGVIASGRAREAYMTQRAKEEEAANAFRLNLAGVPASYVKEMQELIRLNQAGIIVGDEYTAALKKQQDTLLKKTGVTKASAAAVNQEQNTYESLIASIRAKIEANKLELSGGAKLTESERLRVKLDQDLLAGKIKLGSALERSVRLSLEELQASEASLAVAQEATKAALAAAAARSKEADGIQAWIDAQEQAARQALQSVADRVASLRDEEQAVGLAVAQNISLAEAVEQVALARLQEKQAGFYEGSEGYEAIQKEIAARKELLGLVRGKAQREAATDAAKRAADEWQRTADDINRSLTDALLRGFESGKGFAKNFVDTMKNLFSTLVLRPIISAVVSPVAGAITGALGLAGAANAGTSALSTVGTGASIFNAGSALGGLGAVGGAIQGFGTAMMASVQSLAGITGTTAQMVTSLTAAGHVAAPGMASGVGAFNAIPGWGWALAGVAALASIFGKKSTPHIGGGATYGADMGLTMGPASNNFLREWTIPESAYRDDANKAAATMAKTISQTLDGVAKQFGQQMGYVVGTGFADDSSKDGAWGALRIALGDRTVADWGNPDDKWAGVTFADGEKGAQEYAAKIASTVREVLNGMDLPGWASRIAKSMPEQATLDDLTAALATISAYPAQLLQQFGSDRDSLVAQWVEGLNAGDAMAAGQSVADALLVNLRNSLFARSAGEVFDIMNMGIVTPMLDAIATGATVSEALSSASIEATIARAKAQAATLAELFGNAEFQELLETMRGAFAQGLGQAGQSLQSLPYTVQTIDTAAQAVASAADDAARAAEEARKRWQDITDALLGDRFDAEVALLRAMGNEEEALARERAKAIEGYDAYQVALYDGTAAIWQQVEALEQQAELQRTIAAELPAVLDQYRTPGQRMAAGYDRIAADLGAAGINVSAQTLMGASKDQIAQAAMAVYNLGTTSDEMRLALIRAASGLADLKDQALDLAQGRTDAAYSALEREVNARKAVVQETIADVRSVFEATGDAARSLMGEVASTRGMMGAQGRAFIDNALNNARATGYLPESDALQQAIAATVGDLGKQVYATQFEADRDRLVLAGKLAELEGISGEQLTEAEKQLKSLDGILDTARQQIDTLRGIDTGILGVDARIAQLATALLSEKAAKDAAAGLGKLPGSAGAAPADWAKFGAGDWVANNTGTWVADASTGMLYGQDGSTTHRGSLVNEAMALINAGRAMEVYDAVKASGFTLEQAEKILGYDLKDYVTGTLGLPSFDVGTNYVPRDMVAQIHKGEAIVPAAFNPWANGGGMSTARLEALVSQLVDDNRAQAGQIIRLQNTIAKLMQQWNVDGLPPEREEATA